MVNRRNAKPFLWIKNLHNALGLGSALFLVLLLASGVALNHPTRLIPGAYAERYALASDPVHINRLYRGTRSALERSEDGGETWEEVPMLFPAIDVVDIDFHPGNSDIIYVLQRWNGPLRSLDGGVVWEKTLLPFDPQAAGVELIALSVAAHGDVYLETSAGLLRLPHSSPLPAARGEGQGEGREAVWQAVDFDLSRKNWSRLIKTLHNGHFFGPWFVKVYDATAVALLVLIISGIILWRVKAT